MTAKRPLHLFEATGVELEYMIVDRATLDVKPVADELLKAESGAYGDVDVGDVSWSNELALHVVEIKTNGPTQSLTGLPVSFGQSVGRINELLRPMGAMVMPGAMHPWMDPQREMRLWPHDYSAVYEAFDRIFSTKGHGWANLQSMHVNLPFGSDEEFGRLHAAIRLVLPILPALAASSPIVEGKPTGLMDSRLDVYRGNSKRVPSVAGRVIPEPVFTRAAYEDLILRRIYDDLRPFDPDGILRYEWANARGCIARFDRSAIEIRVIDVQECPRADVAIAAATTAVVKALAEGSLSDQSAQRSWAVEPLADIFLSTVKSAGEALITDASYLETLGYRPRAKGGGGPRCTAAELWQYLIETTLGTDPSWGEWAPALGVMVTEGCLARRIITALGGDTRRERMREVYGELCACLAEGRTFRAGA